MPKKTKFFIHQRLDFNHVILQKSLVKYLYTKFFILKVITLSKKKKTLLLDNYNSEFIFKLKKKFKKFKKKGKMGKKKDKVKKKTFFYKSKLKYGSTLKGNLFLYKHSKLHYYYFISLNFNFTTRFKKKFFNRVVNLKHFYKKINLFFYKNVRGGFLGFSSVSTVGFISKINILKSKNIYFKYKKYFILFSAHYIPYNFVKAKSLLLSNSGFIKNFRKSRKSKRRRLKFKRFKFYFGFYQPYFKKILNFHFYFLKLVKRLGFNSHLKKKYFYTLFLKVFLFLK